MAKRKNKITSAQARRQRNKRREKKEPAAMSGREPMPQLLDRRLMEAEMKRELLGEDITDDPAQNLVYQALEEPAPAVRRRLAREALGLDADCVEAYVLAAEESNSLEDAKELYRRGTEAGRRVLRDEFESMRGHFWGILETRPFMRSLAGLGQTLDSAGRSEEAMECFQELLDLNPNDNQGVRFDLVSIYLKLDRRDELAALLQAYEDDYSSHWSYGRALLAFREEGESDDARAALAAACEQNPHVPRYLLQERRLPESAPRTYSPGHESEAVLYVAAARGAWVETPGALDWLRRSQLAGSNKAARRQTTRKTPAGGSSPKRRVMELPAVEETWQMGLRNLTLDGASQWFAMVTDVAGETPPHCLEPASERPSPREALRILRQAMEQPLIGAPRRPAAVEMEDGRLANALRPPLDEVGVNCLLVNSLPVVDQAVLIIKQQSGADALDDVSTADVSALPLAADEVWQAAIKPLPVWLFDETAERDEPPHVLLIVSLPSHAIVGTQMYSRPVDDEAFADRLLRAMAAPSIGPPRRPKVVETVGEVAERLDETLDAIGVRRVSVSSFPAVDETFKLLVDDMFPERPTSLMAGRGGSESQARGIYSAAAEFWRARPWRKTAPDSVIRFCCDELRVREWFLVVMGQNGETFGLAAYDDWEQLSSIISGRRTGPQNAASMQALSLMFGERSSTSPLDVGAADKLGWPVAAPEAYPNLTRVDPGMQFSNPDAREQRLMEAALLAVPRFVSRGGKEQDFVVKTAGGPLRVFLARQD